MSGRSLKSEAKWQFSLLNFFNIVSDDRTEFNRKVKDYKTNQQRIFDLFNPLSYIHLMS